MTGFAMLLLAGKAFTFGFRISAAFFLTRHISVHWWTIDRSERTWVKMQNKFEYMGNGSTAKSITSTSPCPRLPYSTLNSTRPNLPTMPQPHALSQRRSTTQPTTTSSTSSQRPRPTPQDPNRPRLLAQGVLRDQRPYANLLRCPFPSRQPPHALPFWLATNVADYRL